LLTLLTTASSLSPPHPAAPEPYPLSLHDALPISFPSGDEDAAAAQRRRGGDVREPVSHKPGAGEVDPQRRGRVPEQLRARLAAIAGAGQVGVVRAEVGAVEACAVGGEQLAQAPLHRRVL